jgi:hypothetical protein
MGSTAVADNVSPDLVFTAPSIGEQARSTPFNPPSLAIEFFIRFEFAAVEYVTGAPWERSSKGSDSHPLHHLQNCQPTTMI